MSIGEAVVNAVKFVVDVIEMIIKITFPIGWDELGVIATVSAVIVALVANKKASEQLKSALEMQEQSKNVSLLDKRVELAEAIQHGRSVSELTLQVLFNDEIANHYKAWKNHLTEKVCADHDLDRFFAQVKEPDGEGGYYTDVKDTLEKYIADMSRPDCPQRVIDDYEEYCNKHIVYLPDGETGTTIPYNHSEITTRIGNASKAAKQEQALTLKLVEKFISDSIKRIDAKPPKPPKPSKILTSLWKKKGTGEDKDGGN